MVVLSGYTRTAGIALFALIGVNFERYASLVPFRYLWGHTEASRCNFMRFVVLLHSAAGEPDG